MEKIPDQMVEEFERYKELRSEITYEAQLAVSRTTWSIAAQAFLFTSLAAGIKTVGDAARLSDSLLHPLVPIVGSIISTLTLISVLAALSKALKLASRIRTQFRVYVEAYQVESGFTAILGMLSTACIPAVFMVAWLIILFTR